MLIDAIEDALAGAANKLAGESRIEGPAWRHRPWPEVVCGLGAKLARALDHAHRHGVLHRDIKPANVLVTADGSPKLADFNIGFSSKVAGATPAAYFGGTVAYMSPEQLEACNPAHERKPESLDGRSDLYSLAIVLWELLTGERPFADEQLAAGWGATLARNDRPPPGRRRSRIWPRAFLGTGRPDCATFSCDALIPTRHSPGQRQRDWPGSSSCACSRKAHTLLSPPLQSWRRVARRFPVTWVLLAAVLPERLRGGLQLLLQPPGDHRPPAEFAEGV